MFSCSEYPFAAFKEMISTLNSELKTAKDPEIAAIYEYIADQSLSKTYKIFFKLANPSFVIKKNPPVFIIKDGGFFISLR